MSYGVRYIELFLMEHQPYLYPPEYVFERQGLTNGLINTICSPFRGFPGPVRPKKPETDWDDTPAPHRHRRRHKHGHDGMTRHDTTRHDTTNGERKNRVVPYPKTREAASLANSVALPVAVHKTPTPIPKPNPKFLFLAIRGNPSIS